MLVMNGTHYYVDRWLMSKTNSTFIEQPPSMSESAKILLCVEDDEDDCSWIREAAAEIDPDLHFVNKTNGREALQYLNQLLNEGIRPHLIFLDINMPVMNGKETLAAIKADPHLREIPIVVFSTSASPRDRLFCEFYHVTLLTKPAQVHEYKWLVQQQVKAMYP